MYALLVVSLTLPVAQPAAKHETDNPLYKNLLETGLPVGNKMTVKFPTPTMPDGLPADKQKAIIQKLIGNDYIYEEFTRNAVVAPQLVKIFDHKGGEPKAPVRGVDVWFVAHGDFKLLEDDKFLDRLVNAGKGDGKGRALTKDELAKRKITIKDEKREGYGHIEFDFLEKVRLSATGHAMWSRTNESVVAAAEIDPRFQKDADFPNRWRPIVKMAGQVKVGDPQPWHGAAMYLKITKLAAPAGAMFIEQHIVFVEPEGWFEGANLLRSKLPPAVQNNVRNMRKEFQKKK